VRRSSVYNCTTALKTNSKFSLLPGPWLAPLISSDEIWARFAVCTDCESQKEKQATEIFSRSQDTLARSVPHSTVPIVVCHKPYCALKLSVLYHLRNAPSLRINQMLYWNLELVSEFAGFIQSVEPSINLMLTNFILVLGIEKGLCTVPVPWYLYISQVHQFSTRSYIPPTRKSYLLRRTRSFSSVNTNGFLPWTPSIWIWLQRSSVMRDIFHAYWTLDTMTSFNIKLLRCINFEHVGTYFMLQPYNRHDLQFYFFNVLYHASFVLLGSYITLQLQTNK